MPRRSVPLLRETPGSRCGHPGPHHQGERFVHSIVSGSRPGQYSMQPRTELTRSADGQRHWPLVAATGGRSWPSLPRTSAWPGPCFLEVSNSRCRHDERIANQQARVTEELQQTDFQRRL